jgi:ribosomal protein S18 acetylase RimI-like enzyme
VIEVRAPRPEELAEVGAITVAAYTADGHLHGEEDYADQLRDAHRRAELAELLVGVLDGVVVGTVTVGAAGTPYAEVAGPGELEFRMLAVSTSGRGHGVGERLVRAVLARAADAGCTAVVISTMDTMAAAHRLYARLGFTPVPERDWEPVPGTPLRVLRRPVG